MTTASTTGEGRARLDFDLGDDEPVISPEATHQKIQEISEKAGFNARAPRRSSVKPEVANIHKPEVLTERRRGRRNKTGRTLSDTFGTRNAGQPLEELVQIQALSIDLREAVMACLCGRESRRWTGRAA